MESVSPHVPEQLVEQLTRGYDALSTEFQLLNDYRRELENKLSWANQQYRDALRRFTPQPAETNYNIFLDELEEAGTCQQTGEENFLDALAKHSDADRRTRAYNIRRAEDAREKLRLRKDMEKDFTTPGTPGKLGCPFASGRRLAPSTNGFRSVTTPRSSLSFSRPSPNSGLRSKRQSFHDPIRAELICGTGPSSCPAVSIEGSVAEGSAAVSAPLCPIRFLDQHSPEEVATYFEKHKHELPRSHELCVKRYQSNEESIRQLDAKYGNLVSMIQGLGAKHQSMLPGKVEDDDDVAVADLANPNGEPADGDRVKRWAKAVSASLENEDGIADPDDLATDAVAAARLDEERKPHFDRPLKDVRVGESPSRPWGITVPAKYERTASVSARSDPTASPRPQHLSPQPPQQHEQEERTEARKCPIDHTKFTQLGLDGMMPHPALNPHTQPDPPTPAQTNPHTSQTHYQPPLESQPPLQQPTFVAPNAAACDGGKAPQMVFTGPVFIGYPAEQAMALLRASQQGQGAGQMG